jgi:hypothetical protein
MFAALTRKHQHWRLQEVGDLDITRLGTHAVLYSQHPYKGNERTRKKEGTKEHGSKERRQKNMARRTARTSHSQVQRRPPAGCCSQRCLGYTALHASGIAT